MGRKVTHKELWYTNNDKRDNLENLSVDGEYCCKLSLVNRTGGRTLVSSVS